MIFTLFLALMPQAAAPQPPAEENRAALADKFFQESRWQDVLQVTTQPAQNSPDAAYYRGLALTKLDRWQEAESVFLSAEKQHRDDKRFPTEAAGTEYHLKNYRAAKRELRRALRLAPNDSYVLNFLASIYFLERNWEAALKYWNRIELPRISDVETIPEPHVRVGLLDRAITFSPLATLEEKDYQTTDARLDALDIFSIRRWEMTPSNTQGSYTITLHQAERNGWGATKWSALLSTFSGLPYQTIYPAYYNFDRSAINFTSLIRWDSSKRRAMFSASMPVGGMPKYRLHVYIDGRDETWDLTKTFTGGSSPLDNLKLRKFEAGMTLRGIESGRWQWETGASYAFRSFANHSAVGATSASLFNDGSSLDFDIGTSYRVISIPEKRFTVTSSERFDVSRFFAGPPGLFTKTRGDLTARWLPRAIDDDFEFTSRIRAGYTSGNIAFDDLSTLGVERDDNDLWLRGISATHDGEKGNSPMGRNYVLWNIGDDKIIYRGDFFDVKAGPFLDAGQISDPTGSFGSRGWLWDPGVEVRFRVLESVEVMFSYGWDVRAGHGAFFGSALH